MEATISADQEEMKAEVKAGQEKMEAAIHAIWSMQTEFVETTSKQVEDLYAEI
jgi:cytochrome c556